MGFRQDDGIWLTDGQRLERLEPGEILGRWGRVDEGRVDELETVGI